MGKKVYCPTCGEQVSEDSTFCEYCGAVLDPDDLEYVSTEDTIPDYQEMDDSLYEEVNGKIVKVELPQSKESSDSQLDLHLREKNTIPTINVPHVVGGSHSNETEHKSLYKPADMSKAIHLSEQASAKEEMELQPQKPYNANADHYWDDIQPEIEDVMKENKLDIIIKSVGATLLVLLMIIYLIFFLPSF